MEKTETKQLSVRAVERALDILLAFNATEPLLSFPEICEKIELPKSTTYRLLMTLVNKGFIEQDSATGKYQLGIQIISLHSVLLKSLDIRKKSYDVMKALSKQCGETIHLYVKRRNQRVCLEQVEGSYAITRYATIGELLPLFCGASGKVLLAYQDEKEIMRVLSEVKIEKFTEKTETDIRAILEQLTRIRTDGYAVTIGEREVAAASVAAPIFDHDSNIVAALAISGVSERFTETNVASYIQLIQAAAAEISRRIGYPGSRSF